VPTRGSRDETPGTSVPEAIADPAAVVDAEGRVVAWNDAAELAGLAGPEAAGREPGGLPNAADWRRAVTVDLADGWQLVVWPATATIGDEDVARQQARILEHLAPGVAHDLVNQVGGIQSFLRVTDAADEHDRRLLQEAAAKAVETVKAFQDLVRTRGGGETALSPARLVGDALALAAHPLQEVVVTVDVADDLPDVHGAPGDLRQALLAVVVNTLDALGWPLARGALLVQAHVVRGVVELAIEDDAPAVPNSALARLFDPRPPPESGRAPLDLAVARHLVRQAGGDLRAEVAQPRGNRFVFELPVHDRRLVHRGTDPGRAGAASTPGDTRTPANAGGAAAGPATGAGTNTILVCDDDPSIRSLIVRVLRREGADAIGAASGEEALVLLGTPGVSLVVADHHLGAMSGPDLYRRAIELRPELRGRFLLVSGDPGDASLVSFARDHGLPVVEKPFDVDELGRLVRRAAMA